MKVPNEIKEKILLASEYYEKAWAIECELRAWLKQAGLAKDLEETPIEGALIDCARLRDGSTEDFIAFLESLEEAEAIDWKGKDPMTICYFTVDESRDGEVWLICEGRLSRMADASSDDVSAWELVEFTRDERFFLGLGNLSWLEEEPDCWNGNEERDRFDCLTNEEAAEYHYSICSGKRLLPAEANVATPCGSYYFVM